MKLLINGKRYKVNYDGAKYLVNWHPEVTPDDSNWKLEAHDYNVLVNCIGSQDTIKVSSGKDGISKVTIKSGWRTKTFSGGASISCKVALPGDGYYNPLSKLVNVTDAMFGENPLVSGKLITGASRDVWKLTNILEVSEMRESETVNYFGNNFGLYIPNCDYYYIFKFIRTGYDSYNTRVAYFGYNGDENGDLVGIGIAWGDDTFYSSNTLSSYLGTTELVLNYYED